MKERIEISQDAKKSMIESIKKFYLAENGEELGELGAMNVLNFFLDTLAPEIYNQGVYDSYKYMQDITEDLLSIQKSLKK